MAFAKLEGVYTFKKPVSPLHLEDGHHIVSTYKTTTGNYKSLTATKGKTYYYKVRSIQGRRRQEDIRTLV